MSEPEGRAGLTDKLDADVRAAGGEAGECRGPYARGERAVAERVLEAVRCGPACGVRKLDPGHPVS